ncbi:MAG: alanine--tRNA ligase, partial [Nanoarchaeota archaeon]|nr:alanine--tRNA ligase [Nanoarchaeota archaeon]
GIPLERIHFLGREHNFWGPAGKTGPCGPSTEMFIDTGKKSCCKKCNPACNCGKYCEIWNDVFMEYNKLSEGKYTKLVQKNVDTGMGVERTISILNNKGIYEIEVFLPIINKIKDLAKISKPNEEQEKNIRIITDHIKASCFILGERICPSNLDRGYVLRKLIRKSIRYAKILGMQNFTKTIAEQVLNIYKDDKDYKHLIQNKNFIFEELEKEEQKFSSVLEKGLKKFEIIAQNKKLTGKDAFDLYQSYGFPIEMTQELAKEKKIQINIKEFQNEFKKHQSISRQATEKRFKSGLADTTTETTKLHTATHLLHKALKEILGEKVRQCGSNITAERLRFDFHFDRKLTEQEIKKVENKINKKIKEALPIKQEEMTIQQAKDKGALAFFDSRYGEKVYVYSIGNYSKEVCAGPHVKNTKELGKFKIIKEESVAAGVRRIKAVLE